MLKNKILFLGYNETKTSLIEELRYKNCLVFSTNRLVDDLSEYDIVISFGYTHIINKETLLSAKRKVLNLHISFLPYNRGDNPNFWSFFDGTPSGVSIHEIDEGIDTGQILFLFFIKFDKNENTFTLTYQRLHREIEDLFRDNIDDILDNKLNPKKQRGKGSHHFEKEMPLEFLGWDSNINEEIKRLKIFSNKRQY